MSHFASTAHLPDTVTPWQRGYDKYQGDRKEENIKFFNHADCPCSNPLATVRDKQPLPPELGVVEDPSAYTHSPLAYSQTCS